MLPECDKIRKRASDSVKASDLCWKSVDKGSRDAKEARQALANGYIDYVCERCIEADISDKIYLKNEKWLRKPCIYWNLDIISIKNYQLLLIDTNLIGVSMLSDNN